MSYKALLFCPDEKTARTVAQVLRELDFQVEACNEPFASVKKLTAEHFDALVVDCENEQNATLLFKSARNSGLNQTSLSIAVVEGQAGVAKAFRIGANLVLTKPINVEQSKGTIRVARGLLRKSESAKVAGTAESKDMATQIPAPSLPRPISQVPTPASFELDDEPEPQPEPAEAALLESMPDPTADLGRVAATSQAPKTSPWQPISKPMASALRTAADATGHSQSFASRDSSDPSPFPTSIAGFGAAVAPAKQEPREEIGVDEIVLPTFATLSDMPQPTRSVDAGASIKKVLMVALVLVAAATGYIGWKRTHYRFISNLLYKPALQVHPAQPVQPLVPPALSPAPSPEQIAIPTVPSQMGTEMSPAPFSPAPEKSLTKQEMPTPKPKKNLSQIAPSDDKEPATMDDTAENMSAVVVQKGSRKPVPLPAASEPAPELAAPGAWSVASESQNKAISGLVDVSPNVPRAASQTVKVSQGVSQGLLVKKVAPVYPQQALQMKIQGSVQIMATISKDGNITNMKLLSGDGILARAAMDAIKQWKYKPYYLDNQPVDIQTQITVNFTLP
jgi:TonB family protein